MYSANIGGFWSIEKSYLLEDQDVKRGKDQAQVPDRCRGLQDWHRYTMGSLPTPPLDHALHHNANYK